MVAGVAIGRIGGGSVERGGRFCRGLLGPVLTDAGRGGIVIREPGGCRDSAGWRISDVPQLLSTARAAVRSDSGPALPVFQPGPQGSAGIAVLRDRDRAWVLVTGGPARDGKDHAVVPTAETMEGLRPQRLSFSNAVRFPGTASLLDRKSTRLNSSHGYISYAVFCLKKKNNTNIG